MNRPDKLGLAQESLKILTRNLKRGDTVALATYAGNTRVVLTPTSNKTQILDAIDNLRSGGGTARSIRETTPSAGDTTRPGASGTTRSGSRKN